MAISLSNAPVDSSLLGAIVLGGTTVVPTTRKTRYTSSALGNAKIKVSFATNSGGIVGIGQTDAASGLTFTSNRATNSPLNATNANDADYGYIVQLATDDYIKIDLGSIATRMMCCKSMTSNGTVATFEYSTDDATYIPVKTGMVEGTEACAVGSCRYLRLRNTTFAGGAYLGAYSIEAYTNYVSTTTTPGYLILTPASYAAANFVVYSENIKPFCIGAPPGFY